MLKRSSWRSLPETCWSSVSDYPVRTIQRATLTLLLCVECSITAHSRAMAALSGSRVSVGSMNNLRSVSNVSSSLTCRGATAWPHENEDKRVNPAYTYDSWVVLPTRLGNTGRCFHVRGCESQGADLRTRNELRKSIDTRGLFNVVGPEFPWKIKTVELHFSARRFSGSPIIRIGLALPVNLSGIVQN
jgi:hypothetical protein